jgi:hypothetical protein
VDSKIYLKPVLKALNSFTKKLYIVRDPKYKIIIESGLVWGNLLPLRRAEINRKSWPACSRHFSTNSLTNRQLKELVY